ncbi:MAG: ATP-binding cassette domain-containing protein [Lachnospiraceae bacterium]|jgi:peptide/nickel transport system ATP-binding protein
MLLDVRNLNVIFDSNRGVTHAVKNVSFQMEKGEILGIVGESGSGKSATSLAIMGLLPGTASYSGELYFDGNDFVKMSFEELRQFKGDEVSMIFQEPAVALNPLMRVGKQVEEMLTLHTDEEEHKDDPKLSRAERKALVLEMFELVELPEPEITYKKYPHELSGGQQQRVMIAMALICRPQLLIADEPTTALDADVQDQILDLLREINRKRGTSIIIVSHDLSVIRKLCQKVVVMFHGEIVERGTVEEIFENPRDEYTKKLVAAITDEHKEEVYIEADNELTVRNLTVFYKIASDRLGRKPSKKIICEDMSFYVKKGEILGMVGESGSGKSTISRAILGLHKECTGEIIIDEKNPQMIFQDSVACLNPVRKIGWILEEPLKNMTKLTKEERCAKVREMMAKVEMDEEYLGKYPRHLSGGQKQRINIARALITGSKFIIADEPVSALDVTIQEQILNLLLSLQKEFELSMLFISHDKNVIKRICDRVIFLKSNR